MAISGELVLRGGVAPYGQPLRETRVIRVRPSLLMTVAFVGFVASLPLENAVILGRQGLVSLPRLLGYAMLGLALLQPRVCFQKPPHAMRWFVAYIGLYALSGLFQPSFLRPEIFSRGFTSLQLLTVMWVGCNLFKYERVIRPCLWGFSLSCLFVSGLLLVGVGATQWGERETAFGQNPNSLGAAVSLGALMLIGMAYGRIASGRMTKVVAWGGFVVVAVAVARTGSRGALVALGAGLVTLLATRGSARTRIRNAVIVVLALFVCLWATVSSVTTAQRWQTTLEEGNMAGRQSIFLDAWGMFKEKPVFGWGPAMNYYELGLRRNTPVRDTHNLFLWLLTELGVVGALPFCIGLALCARAAWRGRRGTQGLLPFALIVTALTVNLSATAYHLKWFWVVLAYALASESYLLVKRPRKSLPSRKLARSEVVAPFGDTPDRLMQRPGFPFGAPEPL